VPVDFLTPEQFRDELTTEAADITSKDRRELRASEAIMRALGLLDEDIDLLDEFNTISTEGVAAFYDPAGSGSSSPTDRSRLRYGPRLPTSSRMRSSDQHYDLSAMQDDAPDDQASAQRALIEGDAQRIQQAYVGSLSDSDMAQYREESKRATAESRRALEGVPPIIRAFFESPYVLGEGLMETLLLDGGPSRINQAFVDPPTSEEHLLDPFTYLDGDDPIEVSKPALGSGVRARWIRATWGAITWYLLLAERLDPRTALRAVDGWGGDSYVIYRSQGRFCVRAAFQGDDLAETAEMERALTAWVDTMPQTSAALTRDGPVLNASFVRPGAGRLESDEGHRREGAPDPAREDFARRRRRRGRARAAGGAVRGRSDHRTAPRREPPQAEDTHDARGVRGAHPPAGSRRVRVVPVR
jgi:hypothetical protein